MKKVSSLKKVCNHRRVYKKMSVNYILWFRRKLIAVFSSPSVLPISVFSVVWNTQSQKCERPSMKTNQFSSWINQIRKSIFITFFPFCTMKTRKKNPFFPYKLHEKRLEKHRKWRKMRFPYGFLFTDFKSMLKRLHNFLEIWNIKFK